MKASAIRPSDTEDLFRMFVNTLLSRICFFGQARALRPRAVPPNQEAEARYIQAAETQRGSARCLTHPEQKPLPWSCLANSMPNRAKIPIHAKKVWRKSRLPMPL